MDINFESFCGGKFWDQNLTWLGDSPEFTLCFQWSALVWIPCGFLWLLLPLYIYYLMTLNGPELRQNTLNTLKLFFGSLLSSVTVFDLVKGTIDYNNGVKPLIYVISPVILFVTLVLAVILICLQRKRGVNTSGVLFVFYTLLLLAGIIPFYMKILEKELQGPQYDMFRFVTFYVYFFFLLIQWFLQCFAEEVQEPIYFPGKILCPENQASFLSRITFWWSTGLLITGYRKNLEEQDVWAAKPENMTRIVAPMFEKEWKKEVSLKHCVSKHAVHIGRPSRHLSIQTSTHNESDQSPLISNDETETEVEPRKKRTASLFKVLAKVYGPRICRAHLYRMVLDAFIFTGPILQSALIEYTENPTVQAWKGYLIALAFFVASILEYLFGSQHYYENYITGIRIKASMLSAVYKKALTMSNEARKTTTVGEIVNLMSVDADKLMYLPTYLWLIPSAPVITIVAVYLLWGLLGPSVLAGLGVMVLFLPINAIVAYIQKDLRLAQMEKNDERIKLISEILNGIKVLKLYAWELSFKDKVSAIRNMELNILKKKAYLRTIPIFLWTSIPTLVTIVSFITYVYTGGILDANKAFVSLSLFNILNFPVTVFPMVVAGVIECYVAIKRIGKFLQNEDIDFGNVQHDNNTENPLIIQNGTFSWDTSANSEPTLKSMNVKIEKSALVAVVGKVGSGKSSLISAFLGEMEKIQGEVSVTGTVAYVPQQAWILNTTLRENILFGSDYDAQRYNKVLEACALKPDLEIIQGGDMAEIGEKGINLSGGQKQRLSLARAVYRNADVYFLDDPLSAVDSRVGKHIFEQVLGEKGMLKNKTRVLVTHGVNFLPRVDKIIVLIDGDVTETGSYEQLMTHDGAFAQFLKEYLKEEEDEDDSDIDEEVKVEKENIRKRVVSICSHDGSDSEITIKNHSKKKAKRQLSRQLSRQYSRQKSVEEEKAQQKPHAQLIEEETNKEGKVKWSVFFNYASALGLFNVIVWFICFILYRGSYLASCVWLKFWSEDPLVLNSTLVNTTEYAEKRNMYLGVYGGLGGVEAVFVLLYAIIMAVARIKASRKLHEGLLINVLKAPMSFFDTVPMGRILNRFSGDIETIDGGIPFTIKDTMNTVFDVLQTFIIISYTTPIFLSVTLPLAVFYYFIQRFYIPTSRQIRRIESSNTSHIFVHFSESIAGASSIRAYKIQKQFIEKSDNKVDTNLGLAFAQFVINRWLALRLEFLGSIIIFAAALFAVISRHSVSGALVGLSISYALQMTQSLNALVRLTSRLELDVISVERVKEYSERPTEAEWEIEDTAPDHSWPGEGNVTFQNYCTRYKDGLPLVLNEITAEIKGKEKIGIVGRTGAGKSSLTVALFRMIESVSGSIIIDGIHIEKLGLHQLRSKLTILPQDPVLFSGTLRMNLDPFDAYSDAQIWTALERAHLKIYVSELSEGLEYECGEGGQNLSVGQRQLICLARTLLRKTKILILDEATAAVDLETDDLIQETIRTEFADCTVITIAHRINTIIDNDRIMILDQGKLMEFDSPKKLLENKLSLFYGMAKDAGLAS